MSVLRSSSAGDGREEKSEREARDSKGSRFSAGSSRAVVEIPSFLFSLGREVLYSKFEEDMSAFSTALSIERK
jgi:hypothetical protein